MKKKIVFIFIVFFMFLIPYLIISMHLYNTVDGISVNYLLFDMESRNSIVASRISEILVNEYDVLKDLRTKDLSSVNLKNRVEELKKKPFIKKIYCYNVDETPCYSVGDKNFLKNIKDLFDNVKKIDFQIGKVNYFPDTPPELVITEKIKNKVFISVIDLGYLNDILFKLSKKLTGKLYLIETNGNIIFDSGYEYVFNHMAVTDKKIVELVEKLKNDGIYSKKGIIDIENKQYLIAITNIEGTTWWLYNLVDISYTKNLIFKSWAKKTIIIGCILIFVFSVITLLIYNKFYVK